MNGKHMFFISERIVDDMSSKGNKFYSFEFITDSPSNVIDAKMEM